MKQQLNKTLTWILGITTDTVTSKIRHEFQNVSGHNKRRTALFDFREVIVKSTFHNDYCLMFCCLTTTL